ncbi:MAG: peptidylprolyl isomerase [Ilumatobacter sp.]
MARSLRFGAALAAAALTLAACGSSADDVVSESPETTAPEAADDVAADPVTTDAPAAPVDAPAVDPSCDEAIDTEVQTQSFDSAPPFCLDADVTYSATVTTNAGTVTIDLDQAAAPETVNSFVFLARNNYFDNTVCHRVIQAFVVQCGDPTATGTGGPGYRFADELPAAGQYEIGSIAMANSGPDTNGSQFFIISGPNGAALPPLYSLFGQIPSADLGVVTEMNARGSLDNSGIPTEEVRIESVEITES